MQDLIIVMSFLREYSGFNSLQTGKCIASSNITAQEYFETTVSIPFKRESVLQVQVAELRINSEGSSFNSLQTGKCIARLNVDARTEYLLRFQFPSNGKVYCKRGICHKPQTDYRFQFPSNGKVYCKTGIKSPEAATLCGFNSLQTGKCIASHYITRTGGSPLCPFQFPSNGKVYCKWKGSAPV